MNDEITFNKLVTKHRYISAQNVNTRPRTDEDWGYKYTRWQRAKWRIGVGD